MGETPRTRASADAASASYRRTFHRLNFIELSFVSELLAKPAVGVAQLHTDAASAVDVVDPRTINFGRKFTTRGLRECHSRANRHIDVNDDRGAAVADPGRRRFSLEWFSGSICSFNAKRKLDGNSGTSRSLIHFNSLKYSLTCN